MLLDVAVIETLNVTQNPACYRLGGGQTRVLLGRSGNFRRWVGPNGKLGLWSVSSERMLVPWLFSVSL